MAQIALVWIVATTFPGFRLPICLKSLSDNSGAESVGNKIFTTSRPSCYFVEVLTRLAYITGPSPVYGVELDVSHIAGSNNIIARTSLSNLLEILSLLCLGFGMANSISPDSFRSGCVGHLVKWVVVPNKTLV